MEKEKYKNKINFLSEDNDSDIPSNKGLSEFKNLIQSMSQEINPINLNNINDLDHYSANDVFELNKQSVNYFDELYQL